MEEGVTHRTEYEFMLWALSEKTPFPMRRGQSTRKKEDVEIQKVIKKNNVKGAENNSRYVKGTGEI